MIVDLGQLSAIGCTKWQSDKDYKKGQMVIEDSDIYTALVANIGHNPSEESSRTYWEKNTNLKELMDRAQETVEAAEGVNRAIEEANTARDEAKDAAQYAIEYIDGAAKSKIDDAEAATASANNAANTALAEAQKANVATVNANQAAANGNTQYNTLKNYHDTVTIPDHTRAEQDHTRANTDHSQAVTDHNTANSDHQKVTTDWRKEFTDAQAERTTEFNRTQAEKQTEFERTEAARQAEFDSKEEHRDWANAKAVEFADDLTLHTRLIGPYAKSIPVALTADYASGKVLRVNASTGMVEAVTKSGWGVTRLSGASLAALNVSGGDTAFLDMGGKMESGIVIFAIETEVRNDSGEVIRRTLTSKYNAQNADVPVDGYLQTDYDLAGDQNLLISHPLIDGAEVIFMRSALAAKAATTQRNNLAQMAKLATKEGVFLQMIAGLAEGIWDTNPESGKSQEWLVGRPVLGVPNLTIDPKMANMDARSGDSKDIVVDKVVGGVIGGNQVLPSEIAKSTSAGVSVSKEMGGKVHIVGTSTSTVYGTLRCKSVAGKKYLVIRNGGEMEKYWVYNDGGGITLGSRMSSVIATANLNNMFYVRMENNLTIDTSADIALLDLTTLFPLDPDFVNSLGSNDASKVLTRLGIIALTND